MSSEKNSDIEFELVDVEIPLYDPAPDMGDADQGLVRKAYRVSPAAPGEAVVTIGEARHDILDIGVNGVAIFASSCGGLAEDDVLFGVLVKLGDASFPTDARVAHVTPYKTGECRAGLEFTGLSPAERRIVAEYNGRMREKLFGKNQRLAHERT